jgi:Fe-Mn family superoxide dismutase
LNLYLKESKIEIFFIKEEIKMAITLDELPYDYNALEPSISKETLEFHHDKHHAGYVNNTNKLIQGTEFEDKELEYIILNAKGGLFNNAAQAFNHSFYWHCMSPKKSELSTNLQTMIKHSFGSLEEFKEAFITSATTLFGSGWTWLIEDEGELSIINGSNAYTPIIDHKKPLLVCDVWEHAYYIDYRNVRAKYLEEFWSLINWDFVSLNLER